MSSLVFNPNLDFLLVKEACVEHLSGRLSLKLITPEEVEPLVKPIIKKHLIHKVMKFGSNLPFC